MLLEPGPRDAANAAGRGIRSVVRAAFDDSGFLPGAIPAIGLFDVLEHIEDAQAFLKSLERRLAPGGRIYLTVPAGEWLWSHEDEDAGHFRRYALADLAGALEKAGLAMEYATGFFGFLPPLTLLRRVLPYRLGLAGRRATIEAVRADHEVANPFAIRLLSILTSREVRRINHRRTSRFGGSCLAVARKP
jgi:SAM-dependent methyltransferase